MQYADNNGVRIAFDVEGSGPPLLLHHGWLGNRKDWSLMGYVGPLAQDFTVITMDARCHADSDTPADRKKIERADLASDVVAVLDAAGVEKAHMLGYSLGGFVGIAVATWHTARLGSLAFGGWDPVLIDLQQEYRRVPMADVMAQVGPYIPWLTEDRIDGVAAVRRPTYRRDIEPKRLVETGLPVMMWCGESDPYLTGMQVMAKRYPDVPLLTVEGDHLTAMTRETPRIVDELKTFFSANPLWM